MNKQEKLKALETIWRRIGRSDYFDREDIKDEYRGNIPWETIEWEPFRVKGKDYDGFGPNVLEELEKVGHFMSIWGYPEEASGWLEWDWALLIGLYTWYKLPEECAAPLFVNERAGAICIPDITWAHRLLRLFQSPESVVIGMEDVKAEIARKEAANKVKREADSLAYTRRAAEKGKNDLMATAKRELSEEQGLPFLCRSAK